MSSSGLAKFREPGIYSLSLAGEALRKRVERGVVRRLRVLLQEYALGRGVKLPPRPTPISWGSLTGNGRTRHPVRVPPLTPLSQRTARLLFTSDQRVTGWYTWTPTARTTLLVYRPRSTGRHGRAWPSLETALGVLQHEGRPGLPDDWRPPEIVDDQGRAVEFILLPRVPRLVPPPKAYPAGGHPRFLWESRQRWFAEGSSLPATARRGTRNKLKWSRRPIARSPLIAGGRIRFILPFCCADNLCADGIRNPARREPALRSREKLDGLWDSSQRHHL